MPPKSHSLSLLFHPKKNQKKDQKGPGQPQTSAKARPPIAPAKIEDDEEDHLQLPDGPYQEFRLLSSSLKGWKYDVLKFDSRKTVDILKWTPPVKLNRKDLRRDDRAAQAAKVPQAVGPMVGPDGKPVIGADGKMVMVDAEGRPIHSTDNAGPSNPKDKGKGANNRKRFQKKTRQVFLVPDEVRQLQREERYPWVIEDSHPEQKEHWIGQLEDVSRAETHAFFMPAANDAFKFVPAHRWYKFQRKLKHELPTDTAEVESAYTQSQKRDPQAWLATLNGGRGASASTSALFKPESDVKPTIDGPVGPGGRRLKAVDKPTSSLFDDDDDVAAKRQRERELGGEGDLDEQVYEEDFADDEETMAVDAEDEEAKETEERMKREYKMANKQREAGVDESDDEEPVPKTDKSMKKMQKMIRSREGNNAYESDEEENPYASSAEEEEEEEPPVQTGPAIQPQPQQVDTKSSTPKPAANKVAVPSGANSRATSPVGSPSLGGHSLIAKRATSPKAPKGKLHGSGSQPGSRATSPNPGSRATSPLANGVKSNNKRKADDSSAQTPPMLVNGQPKLKKKKVATTSKAELEALVIEWVKNTAGATTRDCIQHFNSYLVDKEKRAEFSAMVKRVAILKNGVLALRPGVDIQ